MRVIGIGDNVVDDYTTERTMYPGGNALNFAVYGSMLGCEAAYLGVFGSDSAAGHVRATLGALDIDTSRCVTADGPNGHARLELAAGERIFLGSNEGGIAKTVPMDFVFDDLDYLESFELVHTSAYSYLDAYLPRFVAVGRPLSYDFSDDFDPESALALCAHVDFGFFSCAGWPEADVTDLLESAVTRGTRIAAATRGTDEAIVHADGRWYRQAPATVEPVDTLGAGDAFITAFLVEYVGNDAGVKPSLQQAAAFAARICRVHGAFGHGLAY